MLERLLALAILAATGVYLVSGWPLPRGTTARPGPGFFPLAVGVFGAAVALAWAVRAFLRPTAATLADAPIEGGLGRVGRTAGLLVGFCAALPWTGYPAVAFAFTGLALRALGAGWLGAGVIGLASAVASYYLFGAVLGVPLPRGALFD